MPLTCPPGSKPHPASRIMRKCSASPTRFSVLEPIDPMPRPDDLMSMPDARGHFGPYGGRFVADTLMAPLAALADAYARLKHDPDFIAELDHDHRHYVGRPSPIYHAERLSKQVGGAQILLKREDLNHTGAHKINNTIGQAMLAKRMGKTRIIAE